VELAKTEPYAQFTVVPIFNDHIPDFFGIPGKENEPLVNQTVMRQIRAAMLAFQTQPDGRLEARYQLMGLLEGLVVPTFFSDHFQLNDFTPLHDEIRKAVSEAP
jgi:hypothetical protein